jgi:hypothetical protein
MKKNNERCLIIAIISGIFFGIIIYLLFKNIQLTVFWGFITFIAIIYYFFTNRCKNCENLNALKFSRTRSLGQNKDKEYFSKEECVGTSVTRNRYGDVTEETEHFEDVDYVTVTTMETFEDTYLCQKARDINVDDIILDTGIQCIHVNKERGIMYGHKDIVDQKNNIVYENWREYFSI